RASIRRLPGVPTKPAAAAGKPPLLCNLRHELHFMRIFAPLSAQDLLQGIEQAVDIALAVVMGDADPDDAVLRREAKRGDAAPRPEIAVADGDPMALQLAGDLGGAAAGDPESDDRCEAAVRRRDAPENPYAGLLAQEAFDPLRQLRLMGADQLIDPFQPGVERVLRL